MLKYLGSSFALALIGLSDSWNFHLIYDYCNNKIISCVGKQVLFFTVVHFCRSLKAQPVLFSSSQVDFLGGESLGQQDPYRRIKSHRISAVQPVKGLLMITSSRPCLQIGQGLSTSRFQRHVTFGCRLLLFISLPVAALQAPWGKWVCCLWASLHSCMQPQRSCGVGMPVGTGSRSWEMDFMVKKHPLGRVQGWG